MRGGYPEGKKAIAAGLGCQNMQRKLLMGGFDSANAVALAEISSGFGLFSHTCLNPITPFLRKPENGPKFLDDSDLMKKYKKYREETGVQLPKSRRCVTCDKQPEKRRMLKSCGGMCLPENKPVYCSRECQKAVHPRCEKKIQHTVEPLITHTPRWTAQAMCHGFTEVG